MTRKVLVLAALGLSLGVALTVPTLRADNAPATQPRYEIPDKLPADAKLTVHREESNMRVYVVTFDGPFQFDPTQAILALNIDTVDWFKDGELSLSDLDGNNSGPLHKFDGTPTNPTAKGLEVPPEKITLTEQEKKLVKTGSLRIYIRNPHGVGQGGKDIVPTIATVSLIPG